MEGLAYLTFDADVKEEFVEDKAAMQAMFQLTKVNAEHCGGEPGWGECWCRRNVPMFPSYWRGLWGCGCGVWRGLVLLTELKPSYVLCCGCNQCSVTIAVRR